MSASVEDVKREGRAEGERFRKYAPKEFEASS
jgi:hypothetical protein